MKRESVENLRIRISGLHCYGANDLEKLIDYVRDIKHIISHLESKKPDDGTNLLMSYNQLLQSEGCVETWIRYPKKSTMISTFREYKGDFISTLDDYITLGDTYNLWE